MSPSLLNIDKLVSSVSIIKSFNIENMIVVTQIVTGWNIMPRLAFGDNDRGNSPISNRMLSTDSIERSLGNI